MQRFLYIALPLLLTAAIGRGDVRASLPLHGYSRPGHFIPVRLEGTTNSTQIEITGHGVTPTRLAVSAGRVNVVVPVLTVGSVDGMVVRELNEGKPIPIQTDGNRSLGGGVLGRIHPLVGNATGQRVRHILAVAVDVALDPIDPVPGPPIAWEALDYLIIEAAAATRIGDAKLLGLLTAGVTIIHLGAEPPRSLPWVAAPGMIFDRTDVWALRPALRGPRGSVFEHVTEPLAATEAGASTAARRNLLLAGVLFTIFATGAALLPSRRPALAVAAVGAVVLVTAGEVHVWWARQPALSVAGGWIIVEQPPFTQIDTWMYYLAGRGTTVNLPADLRPVAESTDALARLRPALRCSADGAPIGFRCDLPVGEHLAVLARNLVVGAPATPNVEPTVTSPLLPMVKRGYLQPGLPAVVVAGQVPGQPWPTVVVRAD
ncbi:MAG TPA: hypothetical protein VGR35_11130 [Tepidisphaeraceae bacterium]|nr:hypothetical protein [Tepidisphaeraceae bacterium]